MPKVVRSAAREIILAVKRFCEEEKRNNGPIIPFQKVNARTAALTGVSERTVNRIVSEGKTVKNNFTARTEVSNKAAEGPSTSTACDNNFTPEDTASEAKAVKLVTPGKTRKRKLTVSNLDDFDICVIRRKIQSYYLNNSVPTLRKLHCDLKADINFKGSIESLRKILHKLGFSYKKNKSKRMVENNYSIADNRLETLMEPFLINLNSSDSDSSDTDESEEFMEGIMPLTDHNYYKQ